MRTTILRKRFDDALKTYVMKKWSRNNAGPKTSQELCRFIFTLVNANIPEKGVFAIFNSRRISFLARKQKHETVYQINKKDYLFGKYVTNTGETAEL